MSSMFFILFSCNYLLLYCSEAANNLPKNLNATALIAFGDSILDQGNNNNIQTLIKANFPPYGMDFEGGKATGRFSNSKTPTDLIAEQLGIKELVPAFLDQSIGEKDLLTGVSFASGATGFDPLTATLNSILGCINQSVIPMSHQLEMFKDYIAKLHMIVGEERTNYILRNSVFLVACGTDDFVDNYFFEPLRRLQYDVPSYANFLASKASDFMQEIYKLGGRRILVFSLPPIGCVPTSRTLGGGQNRSCAEMYNIGAQLYNKKLQSKLHSLRSSNNQFKVVYADIYNPLLDIIKNPLSYGFEITDRGCCGTGKLEVSWGCNMFSTTCSNSSRYLFWDSFHPTEKGYKIIVNQLFQRYANELF